MTSPSTRPDGSYSGWALRPDQAAGLHAIVGGELPSPDPGFGDYYVLFYEAADGKGKATGGWALIPDGTPVDGQVHTRGQQLVTMLGDRAGRANTWIADLRDLDAEGQPPKRGRAACPCGSGARVKHCPHPGRPTIFATAATYIGQREWSRRDRADALLGGSDPGPLAEGAVRVAAGIHTLSAKALVTSIVDTTEPGGAIATADVQLDDLQAELVGRLPMLRDAELVVGHTPRAELQARSA